MHSNSRTPTMMREAPTSLRKAMSGTVKRRPRLCRTRRRADVFGFAWLRSTSMRCALNVRSGLYGVAPIGRSTHDHETKSIGKGKLKRRLERKARLT